MNKHNNDISNKVMQKIKSGDVKMKPRVYYILVSSVTVFAVFASGILLSYVFTIMFYWIRIQSSSTMAYGARRNLGEALSSFPWWTMLIAVLLTVLAVYLVRKYGTMYKHKASTIALIIVSLSFVLGLLMYGTGIGGLGHQKRENTIHTGQGRQNWQQNLK